MTRKDDRTVFVQRTLAWAERLDVGVRSIAVRQMRNKWASFSTAGRLTFDSQLLRLGDELQDYVIVHELLHFHAPNHGKLWKSLMRAHLGDYEKCEIKLKQLAEQQRARATRHA